MKIPEIKKWEIIEIDWLDSCSMSGWIKDNLDFAKTDLEHKTIGYFIKETEYSISVVQSRKELVKPENNSIAALLEVPIVAITNIRILK